MARLTDPIMVDTSPIILLQPTAMPLPVDRWAVGKTSGVYAYKVP